MTTALKKKANKQQKRKELRQAVYEYYLQHPCVDCGESDPIVLEFDHIRDKKISISEAMQRRWSKKKVLDEIDKCEVRCANCHRRKTARDQGWYSDLQAVQENG
jgi:5-methylcytosine-specific restriction endonuclease McrA